MPRFFSYKQNWVKIFIEWIFECTGFLVEKNMFFAFNEYLMASNESIIDNKRLKTFKSDA